MLLQNVSKIILFIFIIGQPIPTIYWLKNGVNIDHSDGILELTNIDTNDNAMYTCLAQNIRGEVSKNFSVSVVSDHVYIDESSNQGSYLPDYNTITHLVVPNNPQNTTVEQKGRAVLECKTKVFNFIVLYLFDPKRIFEKYLTRQFFKILYRKKRMHISA